MAQNSRTNTAASTTKPAAKRKGKKTEAAVTLNMATEAVVADTTAGDGFEALMADLGMSPMDLAVTTAATAALGDDEVLEDAPPSEADLTAAVAGAEAVAVMIESASVEVIDAAAAPTDGAVATPETTAAAATKRTPVPRKHYSDKTERIVDRLGDKLPEFTVLTMADASVSDDELKTVMDKTLEIIRAMNKKQQARAGFLMDYISGRKAKPNEVMERVLTVLKNDGCITTGKEGNLLKNLLARPYAEAAARAMGGNTVGMMADLKIIVPDGKGKFVGNPDSLLLMKLNSMLFAAPAAATA